MTNQIYSLWCCIKQDVNEQNAAFMQYGTVHCVVCCSYILNMVGSWQSVNHLRYDSSTPWNRCSFTLRENHSTSYYNANTTALQHWPIVCVCTHSCYIMSVTTTVLVHCLAPSESSTHVNGQSHLSVAVSAWDVTWKSAVMPTAVIRTGIVPSNSVTVTIGVVRGLFVKA